MNYKVFEIGIDRMEYIVAQTDKEALDYHLYYADYNEKELEDVMIHEINLDRHGEFEMMDGSLQEMTFREWLADFKYTEPKLLCWEE